MSQKCHLSYKMGGDSHGAYYSSPLQWRTFLLDPENCEKGQAVYRKRIPCYRPSKIRAIGYGRTVFEALYFEHV